MKKIVLFGAGRSSAVLIDYLLKHAANDQFQLTVADLSEELAQQKTGNHPYSRATAFDINNVEQRKNEIRDADLVISLLPPSLHYIAAQECLLFGKHLVTASYVSEQIAAMHNDAVTKNVLFLNECGLDPGIDHMSAMEVIDRLKLRGAELLSFKSYTGGLIAPESNDNLWNYKFTWNPRNVIIAGQGTAKYIEDGCYKYIPYSRLFKQKEKITVDGYGDFEGYANRDSLAYRRLYHIADIPTLLRGTLRNKNFCGAWDVFVQLGLTDDSYIIEDSAHLTYSQLTEAFIPSYIAGKTILSRLAKFCGLADDSIELAMIRSTGIVDDKVIGLEKATPAQILQHLLEQKWVLKENDKDMIVMQHLFMFKMNTNVFSLKSSLVVKGEHRAHTAMAKTVGLPLGIAARLVLQSKVMLSGVRIPTDAVIYKPVLHEMKEYGINFTETEQIHNAIT